jgi:hypothetical protein
MIVMLLLQEEIRDNDCYCRWKYVIMIFMLLLQEEIRDLLSKDQNRRLELKERPDTGVYVKVT